MIRLAACALALVAALPAAARAASACPTASAREAYLDGRRALATGDAPAALERLTRARDECPAAAVDFYLAAAYEKLGRLRLALDALAKYSALAPTAPNRNAVAIWMRELAARAAAEEQGLPPSPAAPRPSLGAPPPYFDDEPETIVARPRAAPGGRSDQGEPRWRAIVGLGASWNTGIEPQEVVRHRGVAGEAGAAYQLALGYRVSQRARLDVEVLVGGQALPWRDAGGPSALFVTLIGVGLRLDLPLAGHGRTRLLLSPAVAAGLGSLSLGLAPSYENFLALRGALGLVLSLGTVALFLEPACIVLPVGELPAAWTLDATLGVRVKI